jgi:glycosyltransferase involved in cell wall biosynthesis
VALLHSPANTAPLRLSKTVKQVVTLHDVMFLLPFPSSPSLYQRWCRRYYSLIAKRVARRADAILTVSRYSAGDIQRHLGVPPQDIHVVYGAASTFTKDRLQAAALRDELNLPHPYVLSLAAVDPRKNTRMVIEAYAMAVQNAGIPEYLVLIGIPPRWQNYYDSAVRHSGLKDRIFWFDFLPEASLAAMYEGAAVFLYPSLYEGFGIPVLEAMASGCPVISSTTSSIPEIAGDAALLVDPNDKTAVAEALVNVLQDGPLRHSLISKGFQRAARFSWRRHAEETLEIYRKVLKVSA